MSEKKAYQLTPEQLALAQKRKEQKEVKRIAAELKALEDNTPLQEVQLVSRPWKITGNDQDGPKRLHAKIMTWNLLAQCLVRRKLFPTSDCLKASERDPMIHAEIRRQGADILCLQEVDRLEQLLPMLKVLGYSHCYTSGPGKNHGCLIAFKKDLYSLQGHRTIVYDVSSVASDGASARIGNSFRTRNVGLIVSLKHKADNQGGILVATTHLFWHPKYTYERTRQTAILVRETMAFRQTEDAQTWPVVIAGDFNFSPDDPAYALLFKENLLPHHKEMIAPSYVVHSSVDPTVSTSLSPGKISSDEDEATDPDRVITNARPARPEDGHLSISELIDLYSTFPRARSAYHDAITFLHEKGDSIPSYGSRKPFIGGRGANEPDYTSFTHYWKSVLDYIFIFDPADRPSIKISGILSPMSTSDMEPGLPRLGVSGSDHTSLVTEMSW